MSATRQIKNMRVEESRRSVITFSDASIYMPFGLHRIQLKKGSDGKYPLAGLHYATLWPFNPTRAKTWRGFQGVYVKPKVNDVDVTVVAFRLNNGANDYYWDGGSWAIATLAAQWSTDADIFVNMPTFPHQPGVAITPKVLLQTSDVTVTPELTAVLFMYDTDANYDHVDDLFLRSLVVDMEANIRPSARLLKKAKTTTTNFDLDGDYKSEEHYDIQSVAAAYNHTSDPTHTNNLFSTFDPATKVLQLQSAIPAGELLWIDFAYKPQSAMATHTDFSEIAEVPSIEVRNIRTFDSARLADGDRIMDRSQDPPIYTVLDPALRNSYRFDVVGWTAYDYDHHRLATAIQDYFTSRPLIGSVGIDEEYSMVLIDEYGRSDAQSVSDLKRSSATVEIRHVRLRVGAPGYRTVPAVKTMRLTGDVNVVIT